jgi:glutamate-1-semialdehyde 2,1-aminomutase
MPGQILSDYEKKHTNSQALAARAAKLFPSGVTHDARSFFPFPIYVEKAVGGKKWDVDGNMYVDFIGGHGSLLLGHRHPQVMDAADRASQRGTHFGSSHDLEIDWAELVLQLVPCAEKVRFTSSGTEATMMALRLARAYTNRDKVIKFTNHFHGWHDIVVGQQRNDEALPSSIGVPNNFYESLVILPPNDENMLREALAKNDIAAVIIEPTGAHWGSDPIHKKFLEAIRTETAKSGTLFIMDEVITGFRVSPGGTQEKYNIIPDLSTHAKILAGGFPGGCVAGKSEIMDILELRESDESWNKEQRIAHQGTYNANPISAAAGSKTLDLIKNGVHTQIADDTTAELVFQLNKLFQAKALDASAWHVSSMWHLNLGENSPQPTDVENSPNYRPSGIDKSLLQPLRWALYNHGVDLMADGGMVSSAHGTEEITLTVEAFDMAINDLRNDGYL